MENSLNFMFDSSANLMEFLFSYGNRRFWYCKGCNFVSRRYRKSRCLCCCLSSDAYQQQIRQEREHRMTIQRELDERKSKCVGLYGQFLFSCSESFLEKLLYIIEKHCFYWQAPTLNCYRTSKGKNWK